MAIESATEGKHLMAVVDLGNFTRHIH